MFIGRTIGAATLVAAVFLLPPPLLANQDEPAVIEFNELPSTPTDSAVSEDNQGLSLIIHEAFKGRLCVWQNQAYSSGAHVTMGDGIYVCASETDAFFIDPPTGAETAQAALTWRKVK